MSLTERIYGKETAGKPAVSSDTQKNLYTMAANKKPSLANRIAQNGGQPTLYADAAAKQKPSLASRIEANGGTPYADAAAQMKSGNAAKGTSVVFNSVYGKADDRASSAVSGKYAGILKASDYTELSKSGESKRKLFGDARYDYINNIGNFRAQSDVQQAQGRGQDYGKYAFMTDDEIGVYNYLYATQGKKAANAYLSDLEPELDKQWYTGTNRATTEALGKNAATRTLASAMTVAAQPTRTITSMIAMADDAVRTAKGQEINPYSKWRQASNITQDLRADTSQHIEGTNPGMGGKVGSFVYNTAMSAADSAMNALVAKGIGEAVGLTGDTLMKATNILGSALMSSEAASLSIAESKEKGYSNAGALALGLTRGAIEYASEAVGGEWVIRKIKANPLSFVKSMALTMIPEGMEEVMSDAANGVVNLAIDAAFGTEESGIPKMLEYYRTSGTDWQKKHAELATVLAVLGQEGLSFLGGALATLGSSSVQYSTNRANINQTAERLDTTPKNVVQMMQDAQTENPGVIYALAELTDAENADDLRRKIGTKEDMKRAAEYLTQQMGAGGRSGTQEGVYTAGAQDAPAGAQRAQNEGNSTTPEAAINIQEGMNNGQSTYQGRENGPYDLRTGGQAAAEGGAQALAGGRAEVPGGVGADAQADLRQVTPAQLGIRNGGTEAVTVVDARKLGGDAARAYNLLAANNIEPVAVRGAIQVNNGYANAYTESGRVFFRVDAVDSRGNAISPEALVRHELFHNYISEEVLQASDEVIRESMTAEEYDAMYESYRDAYASIYDFENMSEDEIERLLTEEIAADAYAGLNWFSGDAPVQEAVRAETERNAPARRAEAQQETTGPPEGRGTIVVLPDGKKYVQADRQVIFGNDPNSWADQIEGYINRKIRNGEDVILTTDSGDVLKITKDTAGKASFRNYVPGENGTMRRMSDTEYEAKLNAEAHIDELAQISEKNNQKPAADEIGTNGQRIHGSLAKNGWFYRTAWFSDFDGQYYRVTISTADGDNGVVVYNVGKIEKRTSPTKIRGSSDSVAETGARQEKFSSTVTIRQTEGNSQEKSSGKASVAGIGAKTADSAALRRAEALEKSGTDNETIRQETGWYRGMDGQWRFEIDDSGAAFSRSGEAQYSADNADYARYTQLMNRMLTGELTEAEHAELLGLDKKNGSTKKELARRIDEGNATLRDIMQHNALFEAYPEIAETKVKFADMPSGTAGSYNRETNTITLDTKLKYDANEALDALMHEVQHRVQAAEDFASGTNPGYWNRGENYDRAAKKYRDNRARLLNGLSTEDRALYDEYRSTEREMGAMLDGSMLYDESRMDALEKRSDELYRELYGKAWFGKLNRYDRILGDAGEAVKEFYRSTAGEIEARDTTSRRRMTAEERKNTPPDLGDADTVFADGSISALSEERKITPETSEEARYEILKDRTIRPASVEYDKLGDTETAAIYDGLSAAQMTQAKKAIRAIAKKLGLNQVDLKNSRIEFPFRFSNANAGVSAQHQSEYGGSYQDLAKALTCLPTIVENAELIETHTEKKRGTKKENPDLKQVYVLLGAMKDGESIIPIQMEVKEFKNANGGLYMTVAMTKIKESDVVKKLQAGESAAATSLLSDSSISIQDILRNVKAEDGRFLKYAPDAFLNDEQKAAKRRAIQRQTEEYASYKVDGNGKASVEVPGINNRTAAELRREYERRMQEYQKATQRDDQNFPYIDEMLQAGSVVSNSENSPWIDETHEEIRSDLRGTKLYVSEQTWRDFRKDEARTLREQAREASITLSKNQNDTAADVRNMELAEKYGEALFPTDISAPDMLRNIVDRAAKGVSEKQTLADRLWDEARLEGAGRDQQEAYDRMVGALRDQTEVILREFAEDNHLTLREQTKQGSGSETGTKSEAEQRRERLQTLAEQDRREMERLRARENLGAGQRFVPNKSSGEVYRDLMGKGKSEVKVQMTGFLKGTPKESTFKVEVKPTPIGGYYEATIFHDGHKADTLVRALKETAARDAAEEVITMANKNFSEENYQRAKKFEAEKTADEDARIAELFGDPEQLDSTEPSPKSSDAAETENTAAGTTIAATTEKVTSEVIKAERNFREDFEKITSGAMRMFVNAGDTVRRIAKATGSKSLEGYYFNAGAYSQRAGNWIAKGGARTDIDGHRIGASLADTLAPMRKNETKYRDFQLYLLHMHNVDRMKYDNSGELERIKENLRWVKEKYPELRELSNEELRRIANSDSDSPVVRQAAHEIYLAAHNGEAPSLTSVAEGAAYALELERQRAIVEKQGLKPVFGYDVTADDSQTAAQLLEAKNPEFKEWAKEVYKYSDDLIRYRVEAGLITPEFANALKKRYPHYIPTFREEGTNSKRARSARRNGGIVVSNAIGRAVGSDGVLLPLHTALSRKTVSTMRNAGLNQFGLALVREYDGNTKAAEKYIWNVAESEYTPTEAAIESDEDYKPVFENVFSVKDNGKVYDITMDEGLTAAMKAFEPDRFASYGAAKAMKKLNDLFKALCTGYNPFFMIRNGVRDWQDAGFYSTDWKTWKKMYWSAWTQIRKNGEIWQQYKALGGTYASMLDYTTGMVKEPKNALGKAAAWYESLGQDIEAAPRLAEFMTILANKGGSKTVDGVKTGKFTQSDLMEAMLGAADITTNFARGGSVTKALNRYLVPFLNPSIQGFDKFIRNATETRSVKAAGSLILKAALMGIAPALLNALAYRDDDEWDDIPANTKANYYLINAGKLLGDGYWIKIPKGRAIAVLSTAAVYGKEKLDGEDVKFSDVFEVIKSNIAPTDIFNQNIATAWTQAKLTNPDNPGTTWYGGNIESDRLQNYRPEDRYDEKTDELSKAIGKLFKVSPKKVNYLLDQYTGVIGDLLLPLITPATKSSHWLLAAPQAAFTIDTTSTNKTTGEYYDLLDDLKYDANDGDIGAGITRKYVSHAGDEVNDYYAQIRAIQNDKSLSDGEKNRIVRALKAQLIERQKEIIAQAEPYREAVSDYLKAHPELSTDNDAAIAEYAEQYEITEDQAESRMDAIVYREANREVFGAEYALRTYNADVYDKARTAYAKGVSYDTYYDYYFATKEMHADKDENGKSISGSKKAKVVEYINSLDIPPEQKDALYVAAGYTAKSARNQKWNGGSGGSGGRRGRGKRTALKAPTPKAPEIIIPKSGTASSAKAGGTSKTPKVSGNVIADFTKTASGTDIQKAVTQAKRKALKAGNRTVYVEEGSPIDYFLKYGKLPSLK